MVSHAGAVRDVTEAAVPRFAAILAAVLPVGLLVQVLAELPDGLDTVVGRGGVGLSLGQRQRLGLARALGSAAAVLLLDEPTAHLDADAEQRVLGAIIERARAGATVIVVGHREQVRAIGDHVVEVVPEVRYAPV